MAKRNCLVGSLGKGTRAPLPAATGGQPRRTTARDARTATLAVWAELPDGAKVVDRKASRAVVQLD